MLAIKRFALKQWGEPAWKVVRIVLYVLVGLILVVHLAPLLFLLGRDLPGIVTSEESDTPVPNFPFCLLAFTTVLSAAIVIPFVLWVEIGSHGFSEGMRFVLVFMGIAIAVLTVYHLLSWFSAVVKGGRYLLEVFLTLPLILGAFLVLLVWFFILSRMDKVTLGTELSYVFRSPDRSSEERIKRLFVELHDRNWGYRKIAKRLKVPWTVVANLDGKFRRNYGYRWRSVFDVGLPKSNGDANRFPPMTSGRPFKRVLRWLAYAAMLAVGIGLIAFLTWLCV